MSTVECYCQSIEIEKLYVTQHASFRNDREKQETWLLSAVGVCVGPVCWSSPFPAGAYEGRNYSGRARSAARMRGRSCASSLRESASKRRMPSASLSLAISSAFSHQRYSASLRAPGPSHVAANIREIEFCKRITRYKYMAHMMRYNMYCELRLTF